MPESDYLTVPEAAIYANVSQRTIWRRIRTGALPARKFGERCTRVRKEDLERLADLLTVEDPVEDYARRLMQSWPPLTPEQRDRLATLLHARNGGDAG